MRRALLIAALALLALPAAASAASVRMSDCLMAVESAGRSATFDARMHPVRGTERMQARFSLQIKEGGIPGWRRVAAGGLDRWQTSYPAVRRYSITKTVRNLPAPASYRALVKFRWLDADGVVLKRAQATSRTCRQPDQRPDLAATAIVPIEGGYEVALLNRGPGPAGPFDLVLTAGTRTLAPVPVEELAAGERRTVFLAGARCEQGQLLTATVDAGDAVEERDEADNSLIASCPP